MGTQTTFVGWDTTEACFATSYLVLIVGIGCALVCWWQFRRSWPSLDSLSASFTLFSLLEGLSYGFSGIAHHMLTAYYWDHRTMSTSWGHANAGWMLPWTASVLLGPMASALGLSTALSFAEAGVGWIRASRAVGLAISLLEGCLALFDVGHTGTLSLFWAFVAAAAGCCVLFKAGPSVRGFFMCEAGYFVRVVAYLMLFTVPAACRTDSRVIIVHTETGVLYRRAPRSAECWYADWFNQNAWSHSLIAVSILVIFAGILAKLGHDRELAYLTVMRSPYDKDPTRSWGV